MSTVKSSLLTFGVAVGACGALILGANMRDRVDTMAKGSPLPKPLVALRDESGLPDISEIDYFSQMSELLKREYVDPIKDEQKLAIGAIRGMVGSLNDPKSVFMDAQQFGVFQKAQQGDFEGIGVKFVYEYPRKPAVVDPADPETTPTSTDEAAPGEVAIPGVKVAAVAPGGPADRAGIKTGDVIDTIDGRWVVNAAILDDFRRVSRLVEAKKMSPDVLTKMRQDLRTKSKDSLLPMKAVQKLMQGESGVTKLIVLRGKNKLQATVTKGESELPTLAKNGEVLMLQFASGASHELQEALPKEEGGSLTLDLRNNAYGDLTEMKKMLALFLPSGAYGGIGNAKQAKPEPIEVKSDRQAQRHVKLIVDASTRGVAEVFARILKENGAATWTGTPSGDPTVVEVIKLPDGSGFTLATGKYVSVKGSK